MSLQGLIAAIRSEGFKPNRVDTRLRKPDEKIAIAKNVELYRERFANGQNLYNGEFENVESD